ncbi:MAG TPA: 8-oxo-dGTP diphosphatase [Streptosporangiaceae bacterium]|jgi:8-oxo-dGTP diphosphatase|nr:8-oxo-dGTP diphosphatase [Streptosporangiaceae bacterium]
MPTITRTCLCLIRRQTPAGPEVLLGLKKAGFGAGKWVGLGGHIEDGEKPVGAAVREVREESGLEVPADSLQHVASIEFRFPARPSWDQTAEVFATSVFTGEPAESDEVAPHWFGEDELPLPRMWNDAQYWLPRVLAGEHISVLFTFADDCATVAAMEPDLRPSRA